ncbi:ABC transporter substrate-binding protein [Streptomyces hoynatensis]|uniref:ABC transporter substrate-binding protein n=1 Tax=Streptomyces hoynatensis TaxID=1141874 RepID=A0A3A9YLJ3_9ACTN|nr:ABC transporter substrate-binding protein [Streptomyces hoynatensis]RKN37100.1 ABC transporter substrate-binding protein [Streptomyces hoynatensis]
MKARTRTRRRARRFLAAAFALLAVATAGGCMSSHAADSDPLTWKVGVMPCSSDCGFLHMAQEQGFYEKHGVHVEFVQLQSSSQIYPALAAGEVDAIEQSPGDLLIAAQGGGLHATIIGSSMQGMPYAIYAGREYDSLADLAGKSVAISSPTGLPALVARSMLERSGVDWGSVDLVNAGGNADRYRAVVAGAVDAASSPADYVPQAEADGVRVLALSPDLIPQYPRYMIVANDESLDRKPEAARRYLAAMIEGLRYAYDHQNEARQVSAEALGTTPDDPAVTYLDDLIRERHLVDPDGGVDMSMLRYQEGVLEEADQITEDIDLESLVDTSYQQAALRMLEE